MWPKFEGPKHKTLRNTSNDSIKSASIHPPHYPGLRIGQRYAASIKYVSKRVCWKDKKTKEFRGAHIQSRVTTYLVWNGTAWISEAQFNLQFKKE